MVMMVVVVVVVVLGGLQEAQGAGGGSGSVGRACTYLKVLATTADDALDRYEAGQLLQVSGGGGDGKNSVWQSMDVPSSRPPLRQATPGTGQAPPTVVEALSVRIHCTGTEQGLSLKPCPRQQPTCSAIPWPLCRSSHL